MKLGVLFSGGKDSCLALHRAVAAGHEVACLLTLLPERDDSWMFHTPALEWTALQAEALGIAQLTATTPGEPETELADMQALLARAQRETGIAGVVTGALASTYQATRIQRACADLGLWCFNPLWQLPQTQLLEMLLAERYEVVLGISVRVIIVALSVAFQRKTFIIEPLLSARTDPIGVRNSTTQ